MYVHLSTQWGKSTHMDRLPIIAFHCKGSFPCVSFGCAYGLSQGPRQDTSNANIQGGRQNGASKMTACSDEESVSPTLFQEQLDQYAPNLYFPDLPTLHPRVPVPHWNGQKPQRGRFCIAREAPFPWGHFTPSLGMPPLYPLNCTKSARGTFASFPNNVFWNNAH